MRYIALFLLLCFPAVSHADTIHVPGDYATIQAGIDAAVNGDVVLVTPGTYVENIDFMGKAITLTSYNRSSATVLDGNQMGSVVTFQSGEGSDSIIIGFTIRNGLNYDGGGINSQTSSATIMYNIICSNTGNGGGIYCEDAISTPVIMNNIIANNITYSGGGGGGINCVRCSPIIVGNLVYKNCAMEDGGGIMCEEASPIITNNTIIGNTASLWGGGIACWDSQPLISNTIIWDNVAPSGPQIFEWPDPVTVTYCDVTGGWSGVGNIDADPLFVDFMNDDFHLTFASPCKEAGNNTSVTELFDFDGDPRISYGTVDMGADEFYNHLYCTGDFAPSGSIEGKFIGLPATWPVGLFIGSGVLDPPLQHGWGEFYLESPWLLFPLVPIPANGVLEIPAILPSTPAPYDIPMQALIGWELSNLFVLEVR